MVKFNVNIIECYVYPISKNVLHFNQNCCLDNDPQAFNHQPSIEFKTSSRSLFQARAVLLITVRSHWEKIRWS